MKRKVRVNFAAIILAVIAIAAFVYATYAFILPRFATSQDSMKLQVIVGYADGTVWAVQSDDFPLGMAIIDPANQGKEVSWIRIELYITPQFTGTVASYTVSGSLSCKIYEGYTRVYDSGSMTLQPVSPLPTLQSGVPVVIASATITAQGLESLYGNWKDGQTYQLVWQVDSFAMTIKFTDGNEETKLPTNSLPYQFTWNFQYRKAATSSFLGYSISFNKAVGYK